VKYKNPLSYSKIFLSILLLFLLGIISLIIHDENAKISFNYDTGFYSEPFYLEMICSRKYEIHYTLNGDTPTFLDDKYTDRILIENASIKENVYCNIDNVSYGFDYSIPNSKINKCTVLRAALFTKTGIKINEYQKTYYVGLNDIKGLDEMYVVSICTDNENLFSYDNGIYVLGKKYDEYISRVGQENISMYTFEANYTSNEERSKVKSIVSVLDSDAKDIVNDDCKLEIQGGWSRNSLPKSFTITLNSENEELFDWKTTNLNLFAGGNDLPFKCKDYLTTKLLNIYDINIEFHKYIPCEVFVNGEYWGFYYLNDVFDKEYLSQKYNINQNDLIIEKTEYSTKIGNFVVENVDDKKISSFENIYDSFSEKEGETLLEDFGKYFDIDNYINYYAINVVLNNTDTILTYKNNVKVWRKINEEDNIITGGFKFMLYDLNGAYNNAQNTTISSSLICDKTFENLCNDDEFKKMFIERVQYFCKYVFNDNNVSKTIDEIFEENKEAIYLNNLRYYNDDKKDEFDSYINEIKEFSKNRYDYIWNDIVKCFGEEWLIENGIQK